MSNLTLSSIGDSLLKIDQKQKCEFGLNSDIVSKGDLNP